MDTPDISAAIENLYAEFDLPQPTLVRPITPLSRLIDSSNLMCKELARLAISTAGDFLLQRGGAVEPLPSLTTEALAGFLYATPGYGCIFVEREDIFSRRRFSAAHELGHYVLHFRPRLAVETDVYEPMLDAFLSAAEDAEPGDLPPGQMAFPGLSDQNTAFLQMEREANEFAAELLMPTEVVKALVEKYQRYFDGDDLIKRLAGEMYVSRAAVRWRLRKFGLSAPLRAALN